MLAPWFSISAISSTGIVGCTGYGPGLGKLYEGA
jgi:hypothetical protein